MADNNCMTPQGFNENSRLRASDADRDSAASVINNALAEGRLTAEEHSDRLDSIYSARTQAELVPLLADLPATAAPAPAGSPVTRPLANYGPGGRIVAIFGGASRKGGWQAAPVINVVAVFGGVDLDFRDAVLSGNEVVVIATAILGGVDVIVPPEMRVVDEGGVAILGGRDIAGSSAESADQGAPVLRIQGNCVLGGIDVRRKARKGSAGSDGGDVTIRLPGGGQRGEILGQIRGQRREIRDQIHQQRRDIHDQMRQQRRELRRNWGGDSDD
jgi:hypothetical protein